MSMNPTNTSVSGQLRWLLRAEALAVMLGSFWAYGRWGGSWAQFALLFLLPDIALLGYLVSARIGAIAYNLTHSYLGALALLAWGVMAAQPLVLSLALIWIAHIGFDRALGFGLKYSEGFAFTHLGQLPQKQQNPLQSMRHSL
jgi:Domain of unknown function (DUF4260)